MYIKLLCDYFEDCKIQGGNLLLDYNIFMQHNELFYLYGFFSLRVFVI